MEAWAAVKIFLSSATVRWAVLIAVLGAAFGVQALRLQHAKADQLDRSACVAGQPCKPVKWKDEVRVLRPALAAATADLGACRGNEARLGEDLKRQNGAVEAAKAAGDRMAAQIAQGRQAARKAALAAQSASDGLLAFKTKGADVCARLLSVDDQVKGIAP